MKILKGHRFRLDLNEAQAGLCARTAGICRFLWNLALEQRSMAWRQEGRHRVGWAAQDAELKSLKEAAPWIAEAPHHCLQQTLKDLDRAFQNFFAKRASYPTFRKKFQKDSFRFPDAKQFLVDEAGLRVKLPKLGQVPYRNGKGRNALKLDGMAKSITVSREGRHWFMSVLCESEVPEPLANAGGPVGLDLGVAQAITTSTGEHLLVLGRTRAEDRRLARLQRNLGRKKKGSKNRGKARRDLAEFQARIARRRRDSIHKATTKLAKNHGLIVIEDLQVKGMTASTAGTLEAPGRNVRAKAGLNRVILDKAWAEIRRQLGYKTLWSGSRLVAVHPAYTSQRCSRCGHTEAGNRPSQEKFACLACAHTENADVNAANNILAAGLAATTDGLVVAACGAMASAGRRNRNSAA
jgi:putative transposase